jgi:hypothetical protein
VCVLSVCALCLGESSKFAVHFLKVRGPLHL